MTNSGGIDDHGLNQGAWDGLSDAIADRSLQHAEYIESSDNRDFPINIEYFIGRGFDIILTVGPGQQQEILQAAEDYPAVQFVGIDQTYSEKRSNLHAIQFQEAHIGYIAGAIAAMVTKTSVVGAVCESSDFNSIRQKCEGFRQGASICGDSCELRTNQRVEVLVRYREGGDPELMFNDPEWGEKITKELIHQGADVLFAVGGGTGQGAIRAAADAGVYAIGAEKDQWFALPEARMWLITSIYGDSRRAVREWMRLFNSGRQPPILEGPYIYAPLHDLQISLALGIDQTINRAMLDLENGNLNIPNIP